MKTTIKSKEAPNNDQRFNSIQFNSIRFDLTDLTAKGTSKHNGADGCQKLGHHYGRTAACQKLGHHYGRTDGGLSEAWPSLRTDGRRLVRSLAIITDGRRRPVKWPSAVLWPAGHIPRGGCQKKAFPPAAGCHKIRTNKKRPGPHVTAAAAAAATA
uniref:Uncharacterized protein n=1 Tax=Globodera rostochiensis TaxID=31243 RepID=A0A914I763_GLORO